MKARISERLLQKHRGPSRRIEVYDEIEGGLVATLFPSGKVSFYLYENRGRKKTKLADWPFFSTMEARELCRKRKGATDEIREYPTLASFIEDTYTPAYALDHKNLKHLIDRKAFHSGQRIVV